MERTEVWFRVAKNRTKLARQIKKVINVENDTKENGGVLIIIKEQKKEEKRENKSKDLLYEVYSVRIVAESLESE